MEVIVGLTTLPHVAYKMVLTDNWNHLNIVEPSNILNQTFTVLEYVNAYNA